MGQGASQPATGEAEHEREAIGRGDRRRSILRQTTRHSTISREDDGNGENGLFRGEHSTPAPRRRPQSRVASVNRLSQMLRSSSSSAAGNTESGTGVGPGDAPLSRRAGLHRTATRLRGAFSMRRDTPGDTAASASSLGLLQQRTSYVRAGMNRDRDNDADYYPPPRLPSIDMSSPFAHETFSSPDDPEPAPRSSHSNRRSNLRFNALRPDRPFRNFTSSLRRRRSPQPSTRRGGNEDQAAMLSRLLSVAAAATAATLMGDDHQALSEARSLTGSAMGDLGSGGEDGSFDGFLRALQNGRIASALRQGNDGESDAPQEGPLNFFRMFRFGASGNNSSSLSTGLGDPSEASETNSEGHIDDERAWEALAWAGAESATASTISVIIAHPTGGGRDHGAERRNSSSANDSRSWIIYVLGGSYPENHPILTTPSLFTENPTYEDMMLLSALLGPAKAPVATEEDVEQAGGVYTVELPPSSDAHKTAELVAIATESADRVEIEAGQRCLVCLCEYEAKEVARKLAKCNHLFHKECIDQWLTQGRNSCPLCRGEGVNETTKPEGSDEHAGSPSNPAELDASSTP
ncbi:hypothetical protein B0A50_02168 [Salinomyces thailandicus]|uniref:RING-type domain-containing protein n=1 Tax=Salinomyces thailandicus TaxID=706561 RepID=A0A4U0U7U9_9PEZI|nr:hypothetical protein B0A50_02168 [Salinomyces thailandica]